MLSRTADNLFWMARYVERSENLARLLLVGHRMSSMARSLGNPGNEWQSTLTASGCASSFFEKHAEAVGPAVVEFLVTDAGNPSSIVSCIDTARRNARSVRTALTTDAWEALNQTWQQARRLQPGSLKTERLPELLEWVKERSLLFGGACTNTMLYNDAYFFTRLGTLLERADSTARILDVKHHVLLPGTEGGGGTLDHYQWQSILRSASALRSYHWLYHDRLEPSRIAELLILRAEHPRSLVACLQQVAQILDQLASRYGGPRGECHRLAGEMHSRLRYGRIEDVFRSGLPGFLSGFLEDLGRLGDEISRFYLR
ncbi:alpha-E domain-containing protein [Arenibaculum sp.]|jgi:uncharacterized alpha-E superfamily protein|uniref:alpha-E domain-containing protein n=1 Tax=Arenibaculum sp. TaxID=2865862 RepID=UPI002E1047FB|nr:alpha-E domain-containing protein [Arenibaculum sp.]